MKHLPTVTVEEILAWRPCYTEATIRALFDGRRKHWNALQILDHADARRYSITDQFWAVLRPELIPESNLREITCRFALRALRNEKKAGREPDERSWNAIRVARRHSRRTATNEELAAAEAAARAAARVAAGAAAWAAAWAAGAAARAAAEAAARAAAWVAAGAAERKWQLACLKRCLQSLVEQ